MHPVQETLFQLREESFRLQTENQELLQKLKLKEEWEGKKSQYQLVTTDGGEIIYKFLGDPVHYACSSCMNECRIEIIQSIYNPNGLRPCSKCKTPYPIKLSKPARRTQQPTSPSRWMDRS